MFVFLDESMRRHKQTGAEYGVLAGVAIQEGTFHTFQRGFFRICKPYYGTVLKEDDEVKGSLLLNKATLKRRRCCGSSAHWSLSEDLLNSSKRLGIRVFGVVCFRPGLSSFICGHEKNLDTTFRYLLERIDGFMKREIPGRTAKLIFDNRTHATDERNARAITNFLLRSRAGFSYDSIIRTPFFGVSQAHNAGLQLADLVTTVIALCFQGWKEDYLPLWKIVDAMLYRTAIGDRSYSSLKVMRQDR